MGMEKRHLGSYPKSRHHKSHQESSFSWLAPSLFGVDIAIAVYSGSLERSYYDVTKAEQFFYRHIFLHWNNFYLSLISLELIRLLVQTDLVNIKGQNAAPRNFKEKTSLMIGDNFWWVAVAALFCAHVLAETALLGLEPREILFFSQNDQQKANDIPDLLFGVVGTSLGAKRLKTTVDRKKAQRKKRKAK